MGLDMFLISLPKIEGMDYDEVQMANLHLSNLQTEQNEIYEKVKPHIKHFEEFGHSWASLREKVAYWRKANQIHNWFVENLRNGEDEPCFIELVTKDNLKDLYDLCIKILSDKEEPSDILPTRPGCFFGSYDYGEFYYWQIEETKIMLAKLLETFNFETHYLMYECSW
jgi:hypothetical protein